MFSPIFFKYANIFSALSASWRIKKSGSIWWNETKLRPGADQGYSHEGEGHRGMFPAVLPPHQTHGCHSWCRLPHRAQYNCIYVFATLTTTKTQIDVSFLTDSKEGQPILFEYLHPGRCHESGVSRDDVRGHCLPASQGPCRHGEAPLIPQQMTLPTQKLQLCEDSLCLDYSSHCYWILQSLHSFWFAKMPLICLRWNRMTTFLKMFLAETYLENYTFRGINQ